MILFIKVSHITATYCIPFRHALAAKSLPEKVENVCTNKGGSGIEPVRKFRGQVKWGQELFWNFFAICADVFYGRPLGISNKYFNVYCNLLFVLNNIKISFIKTYW